MPTDHKFNLRRWLTRLGYQRSDQPPILYSVQPVAVVSDQSSLTPRYQGPGRVMGGNISPLVGDYGVMQWFANAAGGMIVHELKALVVGSAVWGITPDKYPSFSAPVVNMDTEMDTQPGAVATGIVGSVTAANRILVPIEEYPYETGTNVLSVTRPFFVANGRNLIIEALSVSLPISGWAIIEELPEALS